MCAHLVLSVWCEVFSNVHHSVYSLCFQVFCLQRKVYIVQRAEGSEERTPIREHIKALTTGFEVVQYHTT